MSFTRLSSLLLSLCLAASCVKRVDVASQGEALSLDAPAHRLVYQRGIDGSGAIPIRGTCAWANAIIEARAMEVRSGREIQGWQHVATVRPDGHFAASLRIHGGWYRLEVRATFRRHNAVATVDRVGVGEVFIVTGHSVAHGGRTNLTDATSDLVNTIAWPADSDAQRKDYERSADPQYLPEVVGTHFSGEACPAPFGHGTYFWARFADHIAASQDVPVLLLNAAFGGTSLEHWAKSARGELFEHSFVKAPIRMPYINLHQALRRYAVVTGVRAILADHGQNDWPENDTAKVFSNYVAWVEQARADLGFPDLAVVVNRASPPGNRPIIRRVQEKVIQEVPHCYAGPDYDTLPNSARYDAVHFSESGLPHAARLWADALTAEFFQRATPYQGRQPAGGFSNR